MMKILKIKEVFNNCDIKDEKLFMLCVEEKEMLPYKEGDILLISRDVTIGDKVIFDDYTISEYNHQDNVIGKIVAIHNGQIVKGA